MNRCRECGGDCALGTNISLGHPSSGNICHLGLVHLHILSTSSAKSCTFSRAKNHANLLATFMKQRLYSPARMVPWIVPSTVERGPRGRCDIEGSHGVALARLEHALILVFKRWHTPLPGCRSSRVAETRTIYHQNV